MWELELQGKNVESLSGVVSDLELVGVVIEVEDLENLSNNIEIGGFFRSVLQGGNLTVLNNVGGVEEGSGPFLEGLLDGNILSLEGGSLSGEGVWSISLDWLSEWGSLVGGVEGP